MNKLFLDAKNAYMNKKYKKASALYEKILEVEPNNIEVLINLSDCFYNLSQSTVYRKKTVEVTEKIIELAPDASKPYITLSLLAAKDNFYDQKTYAEKAIKLDPNSPEALTCYGLLLLRENQINEAVFYLEKAINLDPKTYLANYNLLVAYNKLVDIKRQFIQAKKILHLKPNLRNLTIFLGLYLANNRILYLLLLSIPLIYIWLPNNFLFIPHLFLLSLSIYGVFSAIKHKATQHLKKNVILTLYILILDFMIIFITKIYWGST